MTSLEERFARIGDVSAVIAAGVDDPFVRAAVAWFPRLRPDGGRDALAQALPDGGALDRWRPHRAAMRLPAEALGRPVHAKYYLPKNRLALAFDLLFPTRGETSWRMGRLLSAAGVATPEPLLLLRRRAGLLHRETLLLARPLDDGTLLTDELKRLRAAGSAAGPLLREVAILAAQLHAGGFFHGDFTASNVVIAGPAGRRRLWLIDLDRAKDLRPLPEALRRHVQALDLRMLLLTTWAEVNRRSWLRLLAVYLRERRFRRGPAKAFAARVLRARRGLYRLGAAGSTLGGRLPWNGSP